jgi:hypothetical protein
MKKARIRKRTGSASLSIHGEGAVVPVPSLRMWDYAFPARSISSAAASVLAMEALVRCFPKRNNQGLQVPTY